MPIIRLGWLVALGLTALLAGCGGSKSPSTASSQTRAETAQTAQKATTTVAAPAVNGTTTRLGTPAGGPVPSGFAPRSFTAISEKQWWLLGTAPCASPPCTSIVRTSDGGRHFVGLPAPRAGFAEAGSSGQPQAISQLRFADLENGFVYADRLYSTHDGGGTWQRLDLGGAVVDLAIANGVAYAIVGSGASGSGRLMRSPVGRDAWAKVGAAGMIAPPLWAQGNDVFADSADYTELAVSHDQGASFALHPAPVAGLPCQYQELAPPVVWSHCATGTESAIWRSVDGGRTFRLAMGAHGPRLPNSAAFAAASASTAVVGSEQLFRTGDAGRSYSPVGPSGLQWDYLGFSDATHGAALGIPVSSTPAHERLYYTTDGGRGYHLVPVG